MNKIIKTVCMCLTDAQSLTTKYINMKKKTTIQPQFKCFSQVAVQQLLARKYGCHVVNDIVSRIGDVKTEGIKKIITDSNQVFYCKKLLIATGSFTVFRNILPPQWQPNLTLKTQSVVLAEIDQNDVSKLR